MFWNQTWLPKFIAAIESNKLGMHLFPKAGGRPLANTEMKKHFGPLCDTPLPKEYIDPSSDPDEANKVMNAFKNDTECVAKVICRNVGNKRPLSTIYVKPLKNEAGETLYKLEHMIFP